VIAMSERLAITLGRLKRGGKTFEIIIDPKQAFAYLETGAVDIDDILTAPDVYADAQSGEHAKEADLKQVFGSTDVSVIARRILEDGEVQLSAEQRAQIRERIHRRVIDSIMRRGVDPRTGNPHPAARIEAALEEVKFRIRESVPVEKNVADAIDAIRAVLPIKVEVRTFEVTCAPHHAGRVLAIAGKIGEIKNQEWGAKGSLTITLEVPAGMRDELYSKLNDATGADIEITTK
jgi:ribosome maturation protein SDO1